MIPSIDRERIIQALEEFDRTLRNTPEWQGLRIPTQIDTHSAGKSPLVPIEIGTWSDPNRHTPV